MPDPRILKSGDGWRVVNESSGPYAQVRQGRRWVTIGGVEWAWMPLAVDLEGCLFAADLPRIAAALTALHEVLQERTTTQETKE